MPDFHFLFPRLTPEGGPRGNPSKIPSKPIRLGDEAKFKSSSLRSRGFRPLFLRLVERGPRPPTIVSPPRMPRCACREPGTDRGNAQEGGGG